MGIFVQLLFIKQNKLMKISYSKRILNLCGLSSYPTTRFFISTCVSLFDFFLLNKIKQ